MIGEAIWGPRGCKVWGTKHGGMILVCVGLLMLGWDGMWVGYEYGGGGGWV